MTPEQAIVPPFLRRVVIRNYKSIAACDVRLKSRTLLVGRNGAGKSNFLDALHFVADALQTSLDRAIYARGGTDVLYLDASGRRGSIAIHLEFGLPYYRHATYEIKLTRAGDALTVAQERLIVVDSSGRLHANFERDENDVVRFKGFQTDAPLMPPARGDRLYLVNAAALPEFGPAFDALSSMRFYQLNPATMKEIRRTESDEMLRSDGANIASAVGRLESRNPQKLVRVNEYLESIVPEIKQVERVPLGPGEALVFHQHNASHGSRTFYAASMSDGTLRALAILVAANQGDSDGSPLRLIGVEEPETALHPAAAGALMDALREVESNTQVLLTTHSADLLDEIDPTVDALLVVTSTDGTSHITPVDAASLSAVKQHLYSLGDLLRMDQLHGEEDHRNNPPFRPTEVEVS